MPIFGVTGNLACGKSIFVRLLSRKGVCAYDSDKRVHQLYKDKQGKVYRAIVLVFPQAVSKAGVISRGKLRDIVFRDNKSLHKLEKIIHPVIIKDLKQWIKEKRKNPGVYAAEVPLLYEKKLQKYFDAVILVRADRKSVIARIEKKFRLTRDEAIKRLVLFISDKKKAKTADFIIDNDFGLKNLKNQADLLWKKISEYKL